MGYRQDGQRLNFRLGSGRAVTKAAILGDAVPTTGQTFVTIAGDDLVYTADGAEFVAYRLRLR